MGNKPPKKCHSEPVGRRISSQTRTLRTLTGSLSKNPERVKRGFFTEFTLSEILHYASLRSE
ncbi:MAG: hypothetical protein HY762_00845 [Planctomycetes bacterium]|nr:hypothetical protein [Planctomycetota bacterium]